MVTRPTHYNTRYKHDLSPRQQEVLELIARGRTNAEIAERLGVSLDGAKWHVREILSKLNVDSREQAADYWRNYQRPMSRLARTFAAISMPGLLKLAVVGGAALGVAGIAVAAVIALRGGDEGGTLTVAQAPECVVADLNLDMSMYTDDTMHLALTAVAPKPCRFHRDVVFTLHEGNGDPAVVDGNPNLVSVDLTLGSTRTAVVAATWSNWCGRREGFLSVTFPGSDASFHVTDLGFPPCVDPNRRSVLNAVFAPLSSYTFPDPNAPPTLTPGQGVARAFANTLATQVASGAARLFINASSCGLPAGDRRTVVLCATYPANGQTLGFSTTQVVGDSTNEMYSLFGAGAPEEALAGLSLASIGCPVDDTECIRFIVAFKSPSQPALIYLIYERPTDGIPQPRLIGMGLSGDNADTILNGGVTMTNLGETRFTRVR